MSAEITDRIVGDEVSIVLLGNFNPQIFHPAWLAHHGVVSQEDADLAEVSVMLSDISQFRAADLLFDVQQRRFTVRGEALYKDRVKDAVLMIFGDLLTHTPIWQIGLNRMMEFSLGSEEAIDEMGRRMAPPDVWGDWGNALGQRGGVTHGGMVRLIMREEPRPDGMKGYIQADIQPSPKGPDIAKIDMNNHIAIAELDEPLAGCEDVVSAVAENWEPAMAKAESIVAGLLANFGK